jgi:[acyl-carrier-protein] S-malonyltransferase
VVRETYQEASDSVGYDLAQLSFEDPNNDINFTRYTQPVLLTHSTACWRALKQEHPDLNPVTVAGHSLGEYSALVAAGVLSFSDAIKLVKKRGELMGEYGQGEMEALPLSAAEAKPLADEHYCAIAACNLPDQTVVGGRVEDLTALGIRFAEAFPKKRAARLKTEGAFHTYYMVDAAIRFRESLIKTPFQSTDIRIMSNYSGDVHGDSAEAIRSALFLQLFNPVLWHDNLLQTVAQGATRLIEFGGGIGRGESAEEKRPNLEGIVKKTFRRMEFQPDYAAVINLASLNQTRELLG